LRQNLDKLGLPARGKRFMTVSEHGQDLAHALKCDLASETLRTSGRLRLRVTGWSMLPTIWPGDTLELEGTKRDELSAGDIVLFSRDRRLFAHRLLRASGNGIVTHGDAMPRPDPLVGESEVLGRVACIVRNGKCILPSKTLSLSERTVAGVARSSEFGARIIVGIHGLLHGK
jgi:hypothetical protein